MIIIFADAISPYFHIGIYVLIEMDYYDDFLLESNICVEKYWKIQSRKTYLIKTYNLTTQRNVPLTEGLQPGLCHALYLGNFAYVRRYCCFHLLQCEHFPTWSNIP